MPLLSLANKNIFKIPGGTRGTFLKVWRRCQELQAVLRGDGLTHAVYSAAAVSWGAGLRPACSYRLGLARGADTNRARVDERILKHGVRSWVRSWASVFLCPCRSSRPNVNAYGPRQQPHPGDKRATGGNRQWGAGWVVNIPGRRDERIDTKGVDEEVGVVDNVTLPRRKRRLSL